MRTTSYIRNILNVAGYDQRQSVDRLAERLAARYGVDRTSVLPMASGRGALALCLRSLKLPAGSEVIVQSFTCATAVTPILDAGYKPVYVDIDPNNLSLSMTDLERKITPQTKVIIVQHTFGLAGPTAAVVAMARERGLIVIEDCAHALGVTVGGRTLGTSGDAAIISFGAEKMLSTKTGGALLVNNDRLRSAVRVNYDQLPSTTRFDTFRWLLYPLILVVTRRLPWWIGLPLRGTADELRLTPEVVSRQELAGRLPADRMRKLSGAVAAVALDAMQTLDEQYTYRSKLVEIYNRALGGAKHVQLIEAAGGGAVAIKYPVLIDAARRNELRKHLTLKHMPISDWYDPALFPRGADYEAYGYDPAVCPVTGDVAGRIINLPTGRHISEAYAKIISNEIIAFLD